MKLFENNDHFGAAASGHAGGGRKSITFILMALGLGLCPKNKLNKLGHDISLRD